MTHYIYPQLPVCEKDLALLSVLDIVMLGPKSLMLWLDTVHALSGQALMKRILI